MNDRRYSNIACIIMASGLGRRFGSNKLTADAGGMPMIARIIEATEGIFARRLVVTRHTDVADICRERSIDVLLHSLPYRSDTIRLGLEHTGSRFSGYMFCPGDQPLLRQESIISLCETHLRNPESICRLQGKNGPGMPVVFPQWCLDELKSLPEGKGGNVLIQKYPGRICPVTVQHECELMDVDSREDLAAILEYMEEAK